MSYAVFLLLAYLSLTNQQGLFVTQTDNFESQRVNESTLFDITQLNPDFSLFCWVSLNYEGILRAASWSINNHYASNGYKIRDVDNIGWITTNDIDWPYLKVVMSRLPDTAAVEGNFTCTRANGDKLCVRIYYPIVSISIAIQDIQPSNREFRVVCTSTGGKPVKMSVSGPSGVLEDNMNTDYVGRVVGTGNDSFTSNTTVHGGRNGDTYTCFATNEISNVSTTLSLSVPSRPYVTVITQISETSVRVEWSQSSGGSTVTGYVIHYSDGMSERNEGAPASPTTSVVSGLANCHTYYFSVEATSEHLSNTSDTWRFELGASSLVLNIRIVELKATSVVMKWDILRSCRDSGSGSDNGLSTLVTSRVQYTAVSSGEAQIVDITGELNGTEIEIRLTGLSPYTNYSIQIATVNDEGDVGSYSDPIQSQTNEDIPGPVMNLMAVPSLTQITITWTKPLVSNGVLISYEVSYREDGSNEVETRMNTTDLYTSYTTSNDLKENQMYNFSVRAYTRAGPGRLYSVTVSTLTSDFNVPASLGAAIIPGLIALLCGLIIFAVSITTGLVLYRIQRNTKKDVAVEDNPAYGAVLRPRKQVSTSPAPPTSADAEYEVVPF